MKAADGAGRTVHRMVDYLIGASWALILVALLVVYTLAGPLAAGLASIITLLGAIVVLLARMTATSPR